jgi:hypothetical protein
MTKAAPFGPCSHAVGIQPTFGRMFDLEPFAHNSAELRSAMVEMGKPGGLLDAADALERGPIDLIVDPELSNNNPNNTTHTAGTTFVGQFMDHDMTFDTTSRLGEPVSPEETPNARTPTFDLDTVYGRGPVAEPELYDSIDGPKLKIESGGLFEDLPRNANNRAIIGDPRNDENLILAGLQAAFLKFHNQSVDFLRSRGVSGANELFTRARRLTTWHYHWMILHEFLPQFVGQKTVSRTMSQGRQFYRPKHGAFIPVEFQGAVFRFGHSMVRPSYRANLAGDLGKPFFGFIFDPTQIGASDPEDMSGNTRAQRRFIGWQTFFDFGDGEVKPNKKIDTKLSTPLFNLPPGAIARFAGEDSGPSSLPQRSLLRHITWKLPSGQAIARKMGLPVLGREDFEELSGFGLGLDRNTPLFYYVLREAELAADGVHLGPVGGRIVAEVIIGLLQSDPASYVSMKPNWRPTLPSRDEGDFRMVDFLTFAGVDPASRGQ